MANVRTSFALTLAQQYCCAAISFISIVILARLLTPTEVGIFSVSAAVIGVAHMIRDFGIGRYLIQEPELSNDRFRTAYGIGLLTAWAIGGALYLGRNYIAAFYGEERLRDVVSVLACNFVLVPFGAPILWMLTREMKFQRLFLISVASQIVQAGTSVVLAAFGFSFMSMAWGSFAGVLATTVLASFSDMQHLFLLPSFKAWRRVVGFGSWASAQSLVTELGAGASDLILGRTLGFDAVAVYSRAQGLIATINRDIIKAVILVAFPALAERRRQGIDLQGPYQKGTAYLTVLIWPVIAFMGIMAYPLIAVLFGPNWMSAAPLLQIMCVTAWSSPLVTFAGQALLALGHIKSIFRVEAVTQSLRVLMLLVGSIFGLYVVAALQIIPASISAVMWLRYAQSAIGVESRALIRPGLQGLGVVLCASAGPLAVQLFAGHANELINLIVASLAWVLGWFAGIFVVRHPIYEEVQRVQDRVFDGLAAVRVKRR